MIATDKDGLSLSQIRRIDRLKMSTHREKQGECRSSFASYIPLDFVMAGMILVLGAAMLVIVSKPAEQQLYTRLPADLDQQAPSITIYGN